MYTRTGIASIKELKKAVPSLASYPLPHAPVSPPSAVLQHMDDAAQHAAVIHARNTTRLRGQKRLYLLPLLVRKPKHLRHQNTPLIATLNHFHGSFF